MGSRAGWVRLGAGHGRFWNGIRVVREHMRCNFKYLLTVLRQDIWQIFEM